MKLDLGNTTLAATDVTGKSDTSYTMDLLAAPFRGVEGLAHGVYNLADWVTFDMLPDWEESRLFGRSETIPGSLLEGLIQFAVPFGAIGKGLSVAGKAARAGKVTGLAGKGAKALTKKGTGKFFDLNWKGGFAAEMTTDFVAWDGQEQRLSNLIQQFPSLQNPVTEFLAADPEDSEAYGRAKNVVEGVLIGAGVTALLTPVMAGLRAIKKRKVELEAGASDDDAITSATIEHADAMREARVYTDDTARLESREAADEWDDLYKAADGDPEDFVEMDLANTDWDAVEELSAMSREELEAVEAGGRVIDEVETDTAVIKKYKFDNGSTQTIKIDKIDPTIISASPMKRMWAEEALTNEEVLESTAHTLELIKKGEGDFAIDLLMGLNNQKTFENVYQAVKGTNQFGDLSDTSRMLLSETQVQDVPTYLFKLGKKLDEIKASKASLDVSASPPRAKAPEGFVGKVDEFDGVEGNWGSLSKMGHNRPQSSFDPQSSFRYVESTKTVHWWETPTAEQKRLVREDMEARGYKVDRQRVLDAGDEAQWKEMHGMTDDLSSSPPTDANYEFTGLRRVGDKALGEDLANKINTENKSDFINIGRKDAIGDLDAEGFQQRDPLARVGEAIPANKPVGFWFAQGADWLKFIDGKMPNIAKHAHQLDLNWDRVIKVDKDSLAGFESKYGVDGPDGRLIDWRKVAEDWGGVWVKLDGIESDWTKGWDLSSGAIWENSGLKNSKYLGGQSKEAISESPAGIAELSMRNIEGQPVHPIMQRIEEGKATLADIMTDLEKAFPDNPLTALMRKLKAAKGSDAKIMGHDEFKKKYAKTIFLKDFVDRNKAEGKSFHSTEGVLAINKNSATPIEDILHEGVHAATIAKIQTHFKKHGLLDIPHTDVARRSKAVDALLKDKKVPKAIKEYAKIIKFMDGMADEVTSRIKNLSPEDTSDEFINYWKNPYELITMGLTNETYKGVLTGIKYTKDKTLWEVLIDTIKNVLGMRTTHKSSTAFDALVEAGDKMFALKKQEIRSNVGKEFMVASSPKVKKTIDNVNAKMETGGEQAIRQTGSGMAKSGPTIEGGLRQDEMHEVINQVGKRLNDEGIKPEKGSEEKSIEEIGRQLASVTGADGKTIAGQIAAAKNNPQKLKEIETNMGALRSLMGANAEDIVNFAHLFKDQKGKLPADELEMLEARLKNAVEMQFNLQATVSQIASGFGRGLRATRYKARRIGISEAELANERLRQDYLRKRGSLSTEEVVNQIILASDGKAGGDIWERLVNVNKAVRGMEGGKFMKMLRESYIGALLWGPRTWNINIIGNSIAGNVRQYERYVGGWLSAEPTVRRGVIDSMSYSIFSRDLWKFVSNVWRNGDSLLDASGSSFKGDAGNERVVGAITGENVAQSIDAMRGTQGALEGADAFKTLIDYVGKAYRLPMKMLMSTDEMYKQLEFRRRATVQLWDKAVSRGMTDPKQISEYVYDSIEALVTSSGRAFSESALIKEAQSAAENMKFESAVEREMFMADKVSQLRNEKLDFARQQGLVDSDNNINAMEQLTKEWVDPNLQSAREATFTNELGSFSSKLAEAVEAAPMGWLVLPFIKAPTNILKFGFGRLAAPITAAGQAVLSKPFPGLADASDSFLNMLKSSDPIKRSEARGKLATGVVAWTALYSAIANTDKITGNGPLDPRQNRAWRDAGFMPYSVKIGGKWISYQRLDPIATIVGTIADLHGAFNDHVHGFNKSMTAKATAAGMISLARNLTNKSYLSGIDNFMQLMTEPEVKAESIIGRTFAGFIPNILNQGQSITGDQTIKESRSIMDDLLKKIPVGSDRVDLRRNVLGEPAKAEMFEGMGTEILNPFNPIAWSSKTNDLVLREMAYLHHGFSPPSHMLNRLVDLTAYTQSNGRTAYDRWLGLTSEVTVRNNTIRQALEKLIKSNQYQRLAPNSAPGLPSPRVQLLNRVISEYRQKALDQLFDEFPDIKYEYDQTVVAKRSLKQGGSFQDVLQLLNQ